VVLPHELSLSYFEEFLTFRKISQHGADGFTSLPLLQIFIAFKYSLASTGFEPANLGSNGKHANHYTTVDDLGSY
jgi:hypothetical protein